MTEEEYFRKNYPDSCYGNRLLSPHWDFFQDGVEFGERQSEKKIEELQQQIEKMKCCNNCKHRYYMDWKSVCAFNKAKIKNIDTLYIFMHVLSIASSTLFK